MIESYVEYLLSKCSNDAISSVCELYKTTDDFLTSAKKGFNGTDYILGQGLLILAAESFTAENGYIVESKLDKDARKVFSRFRQNILRMKENTSHHHINIDRETIFNTMIDLNWLLSSKYYHVQKQSSGRIVLLSSISMIRIWLKKALKEVLYEAALYDKERCEQYESAQLKRYRCFPEIHPDSQVRDLYAQGYTASDFKDLKSQAHESSVMHMALFYGLTATAARAEDIRRMR